jgi:hypothetical protein
MCNSRQGVEKKISPGGGREAGKVLFFVFENSLLPPPTGGGESN